MYPSLMNTSCPSYYPLAKRTNPSPGSEKASAQVRQQKRGEPTQGCPFEEGHPVWVKRRKIAQIVRTPSCSGADGDSLNTSKRGAGYDRARSMRANESHALAGRATPFHDEPSRRLRSG